MDSPATQQQNMNKQQRVEFIDRRLAQLYPAPPVPLDHSDPYTLLIAVLLSAQCTDERVNQVTPALFARAATPATMARLNVATIQGLFGPAACHPRKPRQ